METSYFLGANTADGFRSLYGGFCRGAGDYLRIVKGGPGTGKSGFMRAVGREAARRGYDVELVRCSGDPGSLAAGSTAPRRTSPSPAFSARIVIM